MIVESGYVVPVPAKIRVRIASFIYATDFYLFDPSPTNFLLMPRNN